VFTEAVFLKAFQASVVDQPGLNEMFLISVSRPYYQLSWKNRCNSVRGRGKGGAGWGQCPSLHVKM